MGLPRFSGAKLVSARPFVLVLLLRSARFLMDGIQFSLGNQSQSHQRLSFYILSIVAMPTAINASCPWNPSLSFRFVSLLSTYVTVIRSQAFQLKSVSEVCCLRLFESVDGSTPNYLGSSFPRGCDMPRKNQSVDPGHNLLNGSGSTTGP